VGLYASAAEAVGIWRPAADRSSGDGVSPERTAEDEDEQQAAAARRARGKARRYCVANSLTRLGTLTYEGDGERDVHRLRRDVAAFFKHLRAHVGERFPYLWVPEWHKGGHGLHVHFAVNRFVHRSWLTSAWPHGFVHIKLLGDLPARAGVVGESRAAARYLAKYVGKDLGGQIAGLHRYEVAQDFQPKRVTYRALTQDEALGLAAAAMGRLPCYIWRSSEATKWRGPSAVFAQWD
jgi:hypothetical protein